MFSKTAPFTAEEVARCRAAQPAGRKRVILLSDRELEPYFVYEWAQKEFVINPTAISLQDLANTTHELYLTTLAVYTHTIPDSQRRAVERVAGFLDPVGPNSAPHGISGGRIN